MDRPSDQLAKFSKAHSTTFKKVTSQAKISNTGEISPVTKLLRTAPKSTSHWFLMMTQDEELIEMEEESLYAYMEVVTGLRCQAFMTDTTQSTMSDKYRNEVEVVKKKYVYMASKSRKVKQLTPPSTEEMREMYVATRQMIDDEPGQAMHALLTVRSSEVHTIGQALFAKALWLKSSQVITSWHNLLATAYDTTQQAAYDPDSATDDEDEIRGEIAATPQFAAHLFFLVSMITSTGGWTKADVDHILELFWKDQSDSRLGYARLIYPKNFGALGKRNLPYKRIICAYMRPKAIVNEKMATLFTTCWKDVAAGWGNTMKVWEQCGLDTEDIEYDQKEIDRIIDLAKPAKVATAPTGLKK